MPLQLMARTASSVLFIALFAGCGINAPDTLDGSPRWNLDRPFYISVSPTMPKANLVIDGMRRAIGRAGGSTTVDKDALQVLTLLDTDGSYCQNKGVEAWAAIPATGKIYFCHSVTALSGYGLHDLDQIATHELGHVLSNHGWHIGGEPVPGDCPSHAVMSSNRTCRTSDDYTPEDRSYICESRNVVGGFCRPHPVPAASELPSPASAELVFGPVRPSGVKK